MKRNNSYEATKAIYRLKRSLASEILVQKITKTSRNIEVGTRGRQIQHHRVRKAIVGGSDILKRFVYDLSYIAANKNFTTGALFDQTDGLVIIDAKDLPKGYKLSHDDRIIKEGRLLQIHSFTTTADLRSYIIHTKTLETYETYEYISHYVNLRGETDAN